MPSAAQVFFCFVFFVATKKMKLLSGNPDGFDFVFEFQSPTKKGNRGLICCPMLHINFTCQVKETTPTN